MSKLGSRAGVVAACAAGALVLTGAGVAAAPDATGKGKVGFCYNKAQADSKKGGAKLSYFTPGVNKKKCKRGQRILRFDLGGTAKTSAVQARGPRGLPGVRGPQGMPGPQGPQGEPGPALGGYLFHYADDSIGDIVDAAGRVRLPNAGPVVGWTVDESSTQFTAASSGVYRISYQLLAAVDLAVAKGGASLQRKTERGWSAISGSWQVVDSATRAVNRDVLVTLQAGDVLSLSTNGVRVLNATLIIERLAAVEAS